MPDEPTLEEITAELMEGVSEEPAPSPDELAAAGIRIDSEEPTTPEPPQAPEDLDARIEAAVEARLRQTPPAPAPAPAADPAQLSESMTDAIVRAQRQLAAEQARQQRTPAPPQVEPSRLLEDPEALQGFIWQAVQYGQNSIVQQLMPYLERLQGLESSAGSHTEAVRMMARDKAREQVKHLGFTPADFDEVWPQVSAAYQGNDNLLSSPDALTNGFLIARAKTGKPFMAPEKADPMVSADPKSAKTNQRSLPSDLRRDAVMIARNLDLGDDLPVESAEELRRVGLI